MIRFMLWDGNLFLQVSISYGLLGVLFVEAVEKGYNRVCSAVHPLIYMHSHILWCHSCRLVKIPFFFFMIISVFCPFIFEEYCQLIVPL